MNPGDVPGGDVKPWPLEHSRPAGDFRVFKIRADTKRHPVSGRLHEFYNLESVPWVSVLAVTRNRELVMVRQFRHGTNTVEWEVPGGMMDPNETDPIAAAARELQEETGYTGGPGRIIGEIFPNAAILNNVCHSVLIEDCQPTHETEFDPGEDLATVLVPLQNLMEWVASGRIRHAMAVAALFHLHLHGFTQKWNEKADV